MGNIDARRDWGHAREYVEAMWLMLQQQAPDDYVVGTGVDYTVREFIEKSFAYKGIPIRWEGSGEDEVGINTLNGKVVVRIDPRYFRPTEVSLLRSDPTKAKTRLGWSPKIGIDELVRDMIDSDEAEMNEELHGSLTHSRK
jgi:GDPmannose 4,6-dehydratase